VEFYFTFSKLFVNFVDLVWTFCGHSGLSELSGLRVDF
jgi:hypothetical protein